MSEKLYSSRMSSSVTSCHLMTRARIHWPHIQWVVAVHTHMGIDCSCSLCKPWSSGTSVSPCAAELLGVVNIHEQSCTQPYLLNSFVHGNPQLQHPAAAIQLSNWQFVSLLNQSYDSYVKYSLYYSITTSLARKINAKQIRAACLQSEMPAA